MLDLTLAVAHHVLIFALFGVLVAELILVRRGMSGADVARVARIDLAYGVLAGVIVAVGFGRAIFAAKGWTYYAHNAFFWAKMVTFVVVGLLSVAPTLRFIGWRRSGATPPDDEVRRVRGILHAEAGLFLLLPLFAAAMARGYGEFH